MQHVKSANEQFTSCKFFPISQRKTAFATGYNV